MAAMHIPEHINFNGDPISAPTVNTRAVADRERIMEMMSVPDRIVLVGGGGYQGYDAEPRLDLPIILNELPTRLTLADEVPYPDEPTIDERSQSSIAIDENPLHELKLMRKKVDRMSTRLSNLEEDMENRKVREKQIWATVLLGFAATILTMLFRR